MSNELLPCPCCNGKTIICKPLHQITGWVIRCTKACCLEMGLSTGQDSHEDLEKLIAAWNRRFVCLDRNQEKVFAGDEVWLEFSPDKPRATKATVSADMIHGVCFARNSSDVWDWDHVGRIELVKEDA